MRLSRKNLRFTSLIVVVLILLFFLHFVGFLKPLENSLVVLLRPFQLGTIFMTNKVNTGLEVFKKKESLIKENTELKKENKDLLLKVGLDERLKEENDFLRKQLDFVEEEDFKALISKVIGKGVDNLTNSILINVGSSQGVSVGLPVVVDNGYVVGKVIKVKKHHAIVLLVNDDYSQLSATIQSIDKPIGLVKGEYGLGLRMNLIPQTEIVNEGDLVITSGLENNVPRGLVIGLIDSVINEETDFFQEAVITTPVDLSKLFLVSVLIPE